MIFLGGCHTAVILNPSGQIGASEKTIIIVAAILMLIVVLPAIFMTFLFAWKYRESNKTSTYKPRWQFSRTIEITIWLIPAIIITILSILVWITSHTLDPYQPLKSDHNPLTIQVISLDWKWLFIYPKQQIATINQLVLPTNVPIHFRLTSDSVINSFFIPQLGSQIMTMAGMQTQLFLIANKPGTYHGISANFSGLGFAHMNFKTIVATNNQFERWVNKVRRNTNNTLDYQQYEQLAKPTINNPVEYFSPIQSNLFFEIIHKNMTQK
ncbi:cytochrome o ubiquinol oxidase, subunit II [Legionella oakridgensis ATCC 33761 = DSM 21215]|uniref:Ubiquinol oxidase subunit 2 n=3 Tax=Legionella oakridgensis TaxID=29423 RepID=W0B6A4_9GAMM|nr:cytochrome o ubiquinol oxidase, subunit II [Legionella oakridgensis ATCC 33761 = DSM 21215]ETO94130.1 cytochrome bo3 quinol oxidase, subunit 2 [Legionella oakridgensis RV-2-2007]KTD43817.1 cytochrome o ubiquinol oxidase subunit II [Legionella oakridgensis]STY15983.1 cytochrome o ubiquinol oxidase subunit II [Legionella longbeachae]